VIYPITITSNKFLAWLLALNPMSAPLDIFRASFRGETLHLTYDLLSIASSAVIFIIGVVYFRKTEAYFADLV
jgi:lipopolysaccharide transport system permease protein